MLAKGRSFKKFIRFDQTIQKSSQVQGETNILWNLRKIFIYASFNGLTGFSRLPYNIFIL